MVRNIARILLALGAVALALGGVFIYQAIAKDRMIQTAMRDEKVTYLLPPEEVAKGEVIHTAAQAQMVADKVKEHRHSIAPTYDALMQGGKYDPTNPQHLTYSQAINLENYLYLGVMAIGLTQVVLASGVFMIVTGVAIGATGFALLAIAKTPQLRT